MDRMKRRWERELQAGLRVEKTNKLIEAACLIALGLVLLIWSGTALTIICQGIAGIVAVLGIVIIVMFLMGRSHVYGSTAGLFAGVVAVVMGLYLFFNPDILASLVPTIVGLLVLVTGLVDLSESMRIVRQRSGGVSIALVIAVLELILGVVFIIHPVAINRILMKLMALTLLADGIADIWMMLQLGKAEKPMEAMAAVAAGDVTDAEIRPLHEEKASGAKMNPSENTMEGYTTIPRPSEEQKAAPAAEAWPEGKSAADGKTAGSKEPVNEVEQDAREAGASANQELFETK